MGQLLGKQGIDDYDPMHKAGRIEDHMRKQPGLEFINTITEIISEVYNFVNYGQEFEHFFKSFKKLQLLGAGAARSWSCWSWKLNSTVSRREAKTSLCPLSHFDEMSLFTIFVTLGKIF